MAEEFLRGDHYLSKELSYVSIAYLDVAVGISGDMMLGALVDAGVDLAQLRSELEGLPVDKWELTTEKTSRAGLQATQVVVIVRGDEAHPGPPHRSYADLAQIIEGADLAGEVAERALAVLQTLAQAEATVHGVPLEEVHFHELGGWDTLIDIVGSVAGLRLLDVDKLYCSPLPVSHGHIDTAHGRLPVPPPAVAEMLKGVPTVPVDIDGETVTPTGAALAVTLSERIGLFPPMIVESIGCGAGAKDFPKQPNILRLWVGQPCEGAREAAEGQLAVDEIVTIEANIDDMNPELQPYLLEHVFAAGALDVWFTPIQMKKGRLAVTISALAAPQDAETVTQAILRESTTFGVRMTRSQRRCLLRETVAVTTRYGELAVKVGYLDGRVVTVAPEYEQCRQVAEKHNTPLKAVYAAVLAAAEELWPKA